MSELKPRITENGIDYILVGNGVAVQYGFALIRTALYGKRGKETVQPHNRNLGGRMERSAVHRIGGGKTG